MFSKIKNVFSSKKTTQADPFTILPLCMEDICAHLTNQFSKEYYRWEEKDALKRFECLVLAKFLIDYALLKTFSLKLNATRMQFHLTMIDTIFNALLKQKYPQLEPGDIIKNRLAIYLEIMDKNDHPSCWVRLASACTGVDYVSEADVVVFQSASEALPILLVYAQDTLKLVIRE